MTYTYTKTGAFLTEENEHLTTQYMYDGAGRLIGETETSGITKQYAYDVRGNRTGFVLRQNGAIRMNLAYTYDAMSRLTQVKSDNVTEVDYTYDLNGNRASMTYANGVVTTYAYNKANLVTAMTNKKGATVLSSYEYEYNQDGNQSLKTSHDGRKTVYAYDGLGRLVNETVTMQNNTVLILSATYAYSPAGNRTTMTVTGQENYVTSYGYDANNRLLKETRTAGTTVSTLTYAYDKNGNQVSKIGRSTKPATFAGEMLGMHAAGTGSSGHTYELDEYDAFNRLVKVTTDDTIATYTYKANDLRASKTISVNGCTAQTANHVWALMAN